MEAPVSLCRTDSGHAPPPVLGRGISVIWWECVSAAMHVRNLGRNGLGSGKLVARSCMQCPASRAASEVVEE